MRKSLFMIAFLLAGTVVGFVMAGRLAPPESTLAAPPATVEQSRPTPLAASGALPDLSPVAERALKVAANITSTIVRRVQVDPFLRLFGYGDQMEEGQNLGSGVVVTSDGYVLTNNHVVGNAGAAVKVTLPDGKELPAKIVGVDDVTDLAVVKVTAQGLETLPWGDSDKVRIAEWVLAVGNPFQLSGTVTLGIVSTVHRSGAQVGGFSDFIQTDAAINPGSSGGALVNTRGELIGINSMIYSETGGNQGIGFAIPSNLARRIMDELRVHGEVRWGSIGPVRWATMNEMLARRYGLSVTTGVLLTRVPPISPAARSGLQPGDILVAIDGQKIADADQLDHVITASEIGKQVTLDVVRQDGRRQSIKVTIAKRQPAVAR